MYRITFFLVTVILIIMFIYQLVNERRLAYENATETLSQIEQVLVENQTELEEVQKEYRQTCLYNAETIARIIQGDPDVLNSVKELKKIATFVQVDEIHIFNKKGKIFTGTHPKYYNYSFDSGEQMMFFKPMLKDKKLKLVQEITPNTAEKKLMQYSAVWSSNGEFIVQVGMEPVNLIKATEKNELSHIFSLLRVNPEADYYAIDEESGKIVGSTDYEIVGSDLSDIGFNLKDLANNTNGFFAEIGERNSFCVFKKIGSNYVGRVVSSSSLYQQVPAIILLILICLLIVAFFLAKAVTKHMNKYVVDEIHDIIKKMKSIANGNLEETVDIQSSAEFVELSNYINRMVKSLLDNNKKMSYVLSKTNLYIGIYEYNSEMKKVRFTEYIPRILAVDIAKMEQLASDTNKFQEFMDGIRENPVENEPGTYKCGKQYVKLEENRIENEIFGVAIDVTAEMLKRRELERERDIDTLTGLYNRHGLELKLSQLFSKPDELGYSAMIMVDADGLKEINDKFGHEKGDIYIKKIAEIMNGFNRRNSIASRQGGDEFVLFLYHYESEEELIKTIETLEHMQSYYSFACRNEDLNAPIRFSFGYCLTNGTTDYQKLIKKADEKMYQNKMERKKNLRN